MFIKFKFWVFRNYWWVLLSLIVIVSMYAFFNDKDPKIYIPLIGVLLSFFYFLQKQRLEEMKLFRDIFESCNKRYDLLNEKLDKIYNSDKRELEPEEVQTIIDYFNLCAEEYLYYSQGYVLPEVWDAWFNGMQWYLKDKKIFKLWEKEKQTDSYYGLSFDN